MTLSEEQIEQRRQAPRTHGIFSFRDNGPDALAPAQVGRLQELRNMLEDAPGRREVRRELTARMVLICELGFAHLREQAEEGEDIWAGGIIKRLATYVAESRRLLDSYPDEDAGASSADLIRQELNRNVK